MLGNMSMLLRNKYICHLNINLEQRAFSTTSLSNFSQAGTLSGLVSPNDCIVFNNFLGEQEHDNLVDEILHSGNDVSLQRFRKKRYEVDHWDGVINKYKELERPLLLWSEKNVATLRRTEAFIHSYLRSHLNNNFDNDWLHPHVIDVAEDGYILPHVDSIKFSGIVVAGLSLLSQRNMHLRLPEQTDELPCIELTLPSRSLYILSNKARFELAHSIECNSSSKRRISIIFRDTVV